MSILRLLFTLELMQITLCVCLCFRWHQKCLVASEDTGGKFINFCCSASACRRPLLQQQEGVERVSQIPLSLDRWARVVQVRTDGTLAVPPCSSLSLPLLLLCDLHSHRPPRATSAGADNSSGFPSYPLRINTGTRHFAPPIVSCS